MTYGLASPRRLAVPLKKKGEADPEGPTPPRTGGTIATTARKSNRRYFQVVYLVDRSPDYPIVGRQRAAVDKSEPKVDLNDASGPDPIDPTDCNEINGIDAMLSLAETDTNKA